MDNSTQLLTKIARRLNASPLPGDNKCLLARKIVTALGGTPRPIDTLWHCLTDWVRIIGGVPRPSDSIRDLLARILGSLGGTVSPNDNIHELYRKILAQLPNEDLDMVYPCGVPSSRLLISGLTGRTDANGVWVKDEGEVFWYLLSNVDFAIDQFGPNWIMRDAEGDSIYTCEDVNFPCGPWVPIAPLDGTNGVGHYI